MGLGMIAGGNVINIVINAVDNFTGTFAGVNAKMAASSKTMQSNFGHIASGARVAGTAITAMGVGGAYALKGAIDTAIDYESAFTGVRKTVELSEQEFGELSKRFKTLAADTGTSYVELSKIGELAGQLGVEGVDDISKFTKVIADIAVTTNLTSEQAATDFARFANVMGMPLGDVDKLGSAIVDLGNNYATTEAEIISFAERIAGAGRIAGLTETDVLAIGAALSSVGVEAEAGGTAMQQALLTMNESVAASDEKLAVFAKTAGMTAEEFATMWETNAIGAFNKFVEGLGTQGDKASLTLDEVGLGGIRTQRAFLSLANTGDLLNRTIETSNKGWDENIALTEEAEKRYNTTERQLMKFEQEMNNLKNTMGQALLPILNKVAEGLGKFVHFLGEHPKLVKFAAVAMGIVTALALIIGPILLLIGFLPLLAGVATLAAGGFGALMVALSPILLIIGAIIAIIGALIITGYLLIKHWDKIKVWAKKLWEWIKKYWDLIAMAILGPIGIVIKIGKTLIDHWDDIKKAMLVIWTVIKDFFKATFNKIKDDIKFFINFFKDKIDSLVEKLSWMSESWGNLWTGIKDFFKAIVDKIVEIATGFASKIIDIILHPLDKIKEVYESIVNWANKIKGYMGGVFSDIDKQEEERAKKDQERHEDRLDNIETEGEAIRKAEEQQKSETEKAREDIAKTEEEDRLDKIRKENEIVQKEWDDSMKKKEPKKDDTDYGYREKDWRWNASLGHEGAWVGPGGETASDKYYNNYIKGKAKGGFIENTGIFKLHAGEYVVPSNVVQTLRSLNLPTPASRSSGGQSKIYNININNLNGFNARDIGEKLQEELMKKVSLG